MRYSNQIGRRASDSDEDREAANNDSNRPYRQHPFPELAERLRVRRERRELFSTAPGGATGFDHMPSHQKLFVADMDGNGRDDLVTHSPGASAGDCAMRCRECCPCRTAEPSCFGRRF